MVLLPPEIWRVILRRATLDHLSPETGYSPVLLESHIDDGRPQQHIMAMKRASVLVSHTWRAIALPMLYETLCIDSLRRGRQIYSILAYYSHLFPERSRGRFVRRICVTSMWDTGRDGLSRLGSVVAGIIVHCPFLVVLRHRGMVRTSDLLISPIMKTLVSSDAGQHVRKLDFGNLGWDKTLGVRRLMEENAHSLPSLETLVIPSHSPKVLHMHSTPANPMHAPNLRTLVIPIQCYNLLRAHPQSWHFPSLSEVHLKSASLKSAYEAGFAKVGDMLLDGALNLKVLSLSFDAPSIYTSRTPVIRRICFELLPHFPDLTDLVFHLREVRFPDRVPSHPSLARIGMSMLLDPDEYGNEEAHMDERVADVTDVFEWLLEADFPKLSVVRLIEYAFELYVKSRRLQWIASWTEKFEQRGVTLEWSSDLQWTLDALLRL